MRYQLFISGAILCFAGVLASAEYIGDESKRHAAKGWEGVGDRLNAHYPASHGIRDQQLQ